MGCFLEKTIGDTDNYTFQSKISLLHAFQANFKHWFAYREQNDSESNSEVCGIFVLYDPVNVNSGRTHVIISVLVLQIMQLSWS